MRIQMSLLRTAGYCCSVFLLAVQLGGCGNGGNAAQAKETKTDAVTAVPVEVAKASRGQITASYSGTATLSPDHDAQVAAKTGGVLKKLYVEEGMTVKEGQLLAELEDATQRSQLAQAEAQMRKSDATFAYAQQSIAKQLIPKRDFDQAKFDMENLRAAYESARLQLAYTRILAPIDGVIAERSVKLGNLIQTNQALFRIVGMNSLQAVLNVPERQLGILKPGQPVDLEADALPGRKFTGNILRIAPVVDAASGTFRVTCEFHDKTGALKPGMFGRVEIVYDQRADALTVPRSALIEEDGETAVFVVEPGKPKPADADKAGADAKAKPDTSVADAKKADAAKPAAPSLVAHRKLVKVGYSDGDKVEVRSGLDEGTQVITIGRNAVRDGTAVLILNGDKDKVLADKAVAGAKG
jgi:membrane fusion protein (multidrug efflux system)